MPRRKLKDWYKSKTIRVAILQAIAGILAVVLTEYDVAGSAVIVKALLDIALRYITKEPIR